MDKEKDGGSKREREREGGREVQSTRENFSPFKILQPKTVKKQHSEMNPVTMICMCTWGSGHAQEKGGRIRVRDCECVCKHVRVCEEVCRCLYV